MLESDATAQTGEVAERYVAAWNEPDVDARRRAVVGLRTENGTYTDPLAAVEGHDAIGAVVAGDGCQRNDYGFLSKVPGT